MESSLALLVCACMHVSRLLILARNRVIKIFIHETENKREWRALYAEWNIFKCLREQYHLRTKKCDILSDTSLLQSFCLPYACMIELPWLLINSNSFIHKLMWKATTIFCFLVFFLPSFQVRCLSGVVTYRVSESFENVRAARKLVRGRAWKTCMLPGW